MATRTTYIKDASRKGNVDVIDGLTSTSGVSALSAYQGKVLNEKIEMCNSELDAIANTIISNGVDDTSSFSSLIANSKEVLIPRNQTLIIKNSINITNPIKIYGEGAIQFEGNFNTTPLFRIKSNNVYIKDVKFKRTTLNGTDTGFISTDKNISNIKIHNCYFENGGLYFDNINNSSVDSCIVNNGFMCFYGGFANNVNKNNVKTILSTGVSGITGLNFLAKTSETLNNYIITNNIITDICYSGITMQGQGGILENCIVENNIFYVIGNVGTTNLIPISLAKTRKISCINNIIHSSNYDGHYYGIECVDSSECIIMNNRVNNFRGGIIVNGTLDGVSYSNIIRNNYIKNYNEKGIHLYRSTKDNIIDSNIIESNSVSSTKNSYAIFFESDSKTYFNGNCCKCNNISITSTTTFETYGIRCNSSNTIVKDNNVCINANLKAFCICMMCGWGFGKAIDVIGNKVKLESVDTASSYGIRFLQTGGEDNIDNSIVTYNVVNTTSNKISLDQAKLGNAIYEKNITY